MGKPRNATTMASTSALSFAFLLLFAATLALANESALDEVAEHGRSPPTARALLQNEEGGPQRELLIFFKKSKPSFRGRGALETADVCKYCMFKCMKHSSIYSCETEAGASDEQSSMLVR